MVAWLAEITYKLTFDCILVFKKINIFFVKINFLCVLDQCVDFKNDF
jgi:hypothetical protein